MKIQTAVILAAGMGTRLQELGKSIPKGFLKLGERPIIEEAIARLRSCGIQRIIIVTGHCCEFYDNLKEQYPEIVTVYNPEYATSGSMYSLWCARELLNNDFLLLESDLIFERRAIETVLAFGKENVILLSGQTKAGDEVYVQGNGDVIVAMSKKKDELGDPVVGEFVGISKISLALFKRMLQYSSEKFTTTLKVDYETDALVAVAQSYPIYYTVLTDLLWAEIDDNQHLQRASGQIYPMICHGVNDYIL
jgi:choline kinase